MAMLGAWMLSFGRHITFDGNFKLFLFDKFGRQRVNEDPPNQRLWVSNSDLHNETMMQNERGDWVLKPAYKKSKGDKECISFQGDGHSRQESKHRKARIQLLVQVALGVR